MTPPDRPAIPTPPPPAAAPIPTALRRDGTAPRSRAERLRMLLILVGISLSVAIPTLVITSIFGLRSRPKNPPAAQSTPEPASGLLTALQQSAEKLLPTPAPLGPEPITLTVRPGSVPLRLEKIQRQVAQFGGTATEGLATGGERHLYIDLPATTVTAFRQALAARTSPDAASPASTASPAAGEREHVEIIIRPAGDDE